MPQFPESATATEARQPMSIEENDDEISLPVHGRHCLQKIYYWNK